MAEALARGFIAKGVIKADMVHCTDPVPARREVFESFGAKSENSNLDVSFELGLSLICQRLLLAWSSWEHSMQASAALSTLLLGVDVAGT